MKPIIALFALTIAFNVLLAGMTVDAALTMVPIYWRNDSVVSTPFRRGNDCGNGVVVSQLLGIRVALLTVLASVLPSAERSSLALWGLFLISFCSRERALCVIIRESQEEEVL